MRVLFFGTYYPEPRVRALVEGLAAHGDEVAECNVPLPLGTAWRVRILRRPWLAVVLAARLATSWLRLLARSRGLERPDAVVVGYMGQFDVHLARALWRGRPLVLDHMVPGHGTALDRGVRSARLLGLLDRLDRASLRAADLVVVDTEEHLEALPEGVRARALVVPVGAPEHWFHPPPPAERGGALEVVFFGSYTPLQGTPTIGEAIALLAAEGAPVRFTMIGRGQDYERARAAAGMGADVSWLDWVEPADLPALAARHDVCLGIFGTSAKALRVVPMKVYGGAAAGCAIVTSATPPQERALGEAAVYVPPGDAAALAGALRELAADRERVRTLREAAYALAVRSFRPEVVARGLRERLAALAGP